MLKISHIPKSGDPALFQQLLDPLSVQVLCCRFWWLRKWRSSKMSFPYWRLYWNKNEGAFVYKQQKVDLKPDRIVLIPPNTEFSTDLEINFSDNNQSEYELEGNRIESKAEETKLTDSNTVLHLFIHFTLGNMLDKASNEIFSIDISTEQDGYISQITSALIEDSAQLGISTVLAIHGLIFSTIYNIESEKLIPKQYDIRIIQILEYMDINYNKPLENKELAKIINMATNSFTRYFKEHLHYSPQEYLRNLRVNKACNLLDHSNLSIEAIADESGFSDRYHFSKVFKQSKGLPPAEYKKRFILK